MQTTLLVLLPLQAVSLGGIVYAIRLIMKLDRVIYQHEMMWADFAANHGLAYGKSNGKSNGHYVTPR